MRTPSTVRAHPGHGDQKSHGRKGGGSNAERVREVMADFHPVKIADNDAARTYLAENKPKLTASQAGAVDRYTGDSFLETNARLRSGDSSDPDVARLDAAMRPLPHDLVVTRVVGVEAFGSLDESVVGTSVLDRAYLSTNLGTPHTEGFGGVTMRIAVPKGTRGVLAGEYSRAGAEREVLLDRGLELVVTHVAANDRMGFDVSAVVVPPVSFAPSATARTPSLAARVVLSRERLLNHPGHPDQKSHGRKGGGAGGTVRDSLAKAKDVRAIGAAAAAEAKRITGRDVGFDFEGSDPQLAREHAEGVLRGLERYPNTGLREVRMGDVRDEGYASCSPDGRMITFSLDAQRYGAASYREDLRNDASFGHSVTGTPMGTALHEYGHAVANHYTLNGWADNRADQYAEIEMGTSDTGAAVSKAISRYAASSQRELAAEAFADVMVNGDKASGMSKDIVKKFDDEIAYADAPVEDDE